MKKPWWPVFEIQPGGLSIHSEWFDETFTDYATSEDTQETSRQLNALRPCAVDAERSALLTSLIERGLLEDVVPSPDGAYRLSLMQQVWIEAVSQLRTYAVTWEQLAKLRAWLCTPYKEFSVSLIEVYSVLVFVNRMPVFLVLRKDGVGDLMYESQYDLARRVLNLSTHICVDFNAVLQEVVRSRTLIPVYEKKDEGQLAEEEQKLLRLHRSGDFYQITLRRLRDAFLIDADENIDYTTNISEVKGNYPNQDITVIQRDHNEVGLHRRVKDKVRR